MYRRTMLILTALSLLLCVVTVALWVRSYWYQTVTRLYLPSASTQFGVIVNDGHLICVVHSFAARPAGAFQARFDLQEAVDSSIRHASGWTGTGGWDREQMGFGVSSSPARGWRRRVLIVPLWFVAVLLVAAAAWTMRAFLRSRIAGGSCAVCGYDLRATPDRCPECGTLVRRAT